MEIENNWGINQKIIDTLRPGWVVNVFNKNRDLRRILLSGEMGLATKTKQNEMGDKDILNHEPKSKNISVYKSSNLFEKQIRGLL